MASPIAHSLAGAIIHTAIPERDREANHRQFWLLLLAANLADFDLLPSLLMGDPGLFHRGFSHSIAAAVLFALMVYAVCRWRENSHALRIAWLMFAAYGSQLLIDWLSFDPGPVSGIPLLLPLSPEHFIANPTVFMNIERDQMFSAAVMIHNFKAVLLELVILGPPATVLWFWRKRNILLSTAGRRR